MVSIHCSLRLWNRNLLVFAHKRSCFAKGINPESSILPLHFSDFAGECVRDKKGVGYGTPLPPKEWLATPWCAGGQLDLGTWGLSVNHETEGKHHHSGLDSLVPSSFGLPLTANKDGEDMLLVVLALTAFLMAGFLISTAWCISPITCLHDCLWMFNRVEANLFLRLIFHLNFLIFLKICIYV